MIAQKRHSILYDLSHHQSYNTLNLADYAQVERFVEEECVPGDVLYHAQLGEGEKRWSTYPPVIDELKAKAKKLGLWNLFLPKNHFKQGAGFSNLEYGIMAEYMGMCRTASEVRTVFR